MLGKIKAMLSTLRSDIRNNIPIKGLMLSVEGNGGANPSIITSYNVLSIIRTGVGVYNVTPIQDTYFGISIANNSVITSGFSIAPSITSELFNVDITPGAGNTFDVNVFELTVGLGSKLEVSPYDILPGDILGFNLLINAGFGELPPP